MAGNCLLTAMISFVFLLYGVLINGLPENRTGTIEKDITNDNVTLNLILKDVLIGTEGNVTELTSLGTDSMSVTNDGGEFDKNGQRFRVESANLPLTWNSVCKFAGTETYRSEFTQETIMTRIICEINENNSHILKVSDLNNVNNTISDVKWSLIIRCFDNSSIYLTWPLKIRNLYKISVDSCTILGFNANFNNTAMSVIPDSIRELKFTNNVVMIPLSLFVDLLTRVDEFSKDYICGQEETIESLTMINQNEDFIMDMVELPDILVSSEEYMKDIRRIDHLCDFKHLMVVDESLSRSKSTYNMELLTQHSIYDQLRVFNQSHSYIKSIKEPVLHWSIHFPKLEIFDLSWNNISGLYRFEVPIHANPTTLTTINLQHNNITMVTVDQLERLKKMPRMFVDIRNNPIDCSCAEDIEELLQYIQSGQHLNISQYANYSYLADMHCASPTRLQHLNLRSLKMTDVCFVEKSKEYFVLPMTILIVSIVILVIVIIIILRYRQDIQIILFTRFDIIVPCQSRADDMDKKYDAFVSYSSNDEDWIEEFFENMEKKPLNSGSLQFKFCMHHRDFIPGKTIFDNVINSVESSRHTIILLSQHYLGSEFCLYEFQEAFRQSVMEQKRHLIIVMMEDIPEVDLPRDLRRCIKTFTYIRKDDSLFAQRLMFALTIKPKSKRVLSPEKDFNSDLATPSVKQMTIRQKLQSSSPLSKFISNKTSNYTPKKPSSVSYTDNNNSNTNSVQMTDIVKAASNDFEKSGVTNIAFEIETEKMNNHDSRTKTKNGLKKKPEVILNIRNAEKDFNMTSQVLVKSSESMESPDIVSETNGRFESLNSPIIGANLIEIKGYDRSISCLSQDTGYGSDRGSYLDRNLQDICETP